MGLLDGKKAFVIGVANERSIAWGIAKAMADEGAEIGYTYLNEALEKRVRPLAEKTGSTLILPCDVGSDKDIARTFKEVEKAWGKFDILIHAVAFANKADLERRFVETERAGFALALDISAYSLVACTRAALPLLNSGASVLTLSYYGAVKVSYFYNVMGVAKAALESCVRYLAADLGEDNIRVNAISAGPIKTLAASGIKGFKEKLRLAGEAAPLKRNVTIEEVGKAGLYLASDLSSGVTGQIIYVDGGTSILAEPGAAMRPGKS
jgi:enoyl-[acyl-carrier protein] reductase I